MTSNLMDFRSVLDNLEFIKSRSIPEKEWPSHTSSSGLGKVFDPKSVKYKEHVKGMN
jgi:hypothetical protein